MLDQWVQDKAVQVTASICDATGKNGWGGVKIRLVQSIIAKALTEAYERGKPSTAMPIG